MKDDDEIMCSYSGWIIHFCLINRCRISHNNGVMGIVVAILLNASVLAADLSLTYA